jgi:hypothetical protein
MSELSKEHKKVIYDAVRQYQMNCVSLNSRKYQLCDEILNNFFADVKIGYVEPAFELSTERHGGDLDAL